MKQALVGWLGYSLVLLGCHQAPTSDDRPAEGTAVAGRKIAAVTPAIIAEADKILRTHPDAPMGAEFPFEVGGKKYVGRLEQHDNPDGDPTRPQGQHKGITVYSAD
jgi:hypothetical protein